MRKLDLQIDQALEQWWCTMLSPSYTYPKDKDGFTIFKKTERNPDNLVLLEKTISQHMYSRYQNHLLEILNKEIPILYVNCQQKSEHDILFFILKEYVKTTKIPNKEELVSQAIGDHTIVTQSCSDWKIFIRDNKLNVDEIFMYYEQLLRQKLQKGDDNFNRSLLNLESDILFEWLPKLMKAEDITHLNVYLDNTGTLSIDEQSRINELLYTRGAIKDRWLRLKINNGNARRKTRTSKSWHRVEATHDYSETSIKEEDVQEDAL